ncbi:MAG: insulinase family protein [Bacteroidetes bacterium]|nr:insulinase family protein [Bacteroidota bacterium]
MKLILSSSETEEESDYRNDKIKLMAINNKSKKFSKDSQADVSKGKASLLSRSVLPNGVAVITEEIPTVESFALGIFINAGSREDPYVMPGVAHLLEHAVFKKTKTRNGRQIADDFETIGAYLNAFTAKEFTCVYIRALKEHINKGFELLSDIVINPVFTERDLKNEKLVISEEINIIEDDPEDVIFDFCDKLIFGNHPLSNPITGTRSSLQLITLEDLESFHKKLYKPPNILIAGAGNLKHKNLLKEAKKYFSYIESNGNSIYRLYPNETFTLRQEINKKYNQSHIVYGRRIPGHNSDDKYPLAVLNVLLGDGMSSRLYQKLREKTGIAYNVYSTITSLSDCGSFYIYAAADKAKVKNLEDIIKDEITKIKEGSISKKEINKAKELLKTSAVMELESMSARIQILARNEFYDTPDEDIATFLSRIDSVGTKEIRDIANNYFRVEDWNVVIFN